MRGDNSGSMVQSYAWHPVHGHGRFRYVSDIAGQVQGSWLYVATLDQTIADRVAAAWGKEQGMTRGRG